ncbi:GNAT family N-acetyltransferase [Deferribacteraceae bacterium V6Fe1]|nr:GNAT family N-acetyltransferase [Deferribacteraceae bacterium V6Fe1]
MIIRKAKKEDLKTIAGLEKIIFDKSNFPMSIRNLQYHLRVNNMIAVAEIDNTIAGYCVVFLRKKYARIYSIATNPDFRGKKVASTLLEHILSQTCGLNYISLEVRKDNIPAIALYEKYGFKTVKEIPCYYGDGCSALKMKKALHKL